MAFKRIPTIQFNLYKFQNEVKLFSYVTSQGCGNKAS